MARMHRLIIGVGAALALAACDQTRGPVPGSFLREAGAQTDAGTFGLATQNNTQVMNGERDYVISLGTRFANEVPTTITFAFDSAQLDTNARAVLDRQAHWIRQFPEVRFRVYGHTDAVGSQAYNRRLGQRRANAVVAYMISRGVNRAQLEGVVSYGKTQPVIPTPDRERRNRRTVTEVSGFLKRVPPELDGKYASIVYREYIRSGEPISELANGKSALQD